MLPIFDAGCRSESTLEDIKQETLQFLCTKASLTDGNFGIYSAIQALHNLPNKNGIVNPNPPSLAGFPPNKREIA